MRRLVVLAGVVFVGCGLSLSGSRERRVGTQDEAGSVHVAVTSAARWDDYREALQPTFALTPEQALTKVGRISQIRDSQTEDNSTVSGTISPTGSAAPAPGTAAAKPGTPPGAKPGTPPGEPTKIGVLAGDAMTDYWAATALYQEVQLLNRYVRDSVRRKDTVGYVLRLQIALQPRARHQPYDAYSTISFFAADDDGTEEASIRDVGPAQGPEVLPLLVTDNLESSLASRGDAKSFGMSGSAGFTSGAGGGSVGASREKSQRDSGTGLDRNSLLTVARVTGNTLRVRLGAMLSGTTDYAMVPRTHNVSVLVLMPKRAKFVQIVSRTTMVDAETGATLRDRTPEEVDRLLLEVGARYGIADVAVLRTLLGHAQQNRAGRYDVAVARVSPAVKQPKSLWLDLVRVRIGGQYSISVVDLQTVESQPEGITTAATPEPALPDPQFVTLVDDGKQCTIVLEGGSGIAPDQLQGWLVISGGTRIARRKVILKDGRITLVFESLKGRSGAKTERLELALAGKTAEYGVK